MNDNEAARYLKWAGAILIAVVLVCLLGPLSLLVFIGAACVYWGPAKRALKASGWTMKDDGYEEAKAVKELRRTLDGGAPQ